MEVVGLVLLSYQEAVGHLLVFVMPIVNSKYGDDDHSVVCIPSGRCSRGSSKGFPMAQCLSLPDVEPLMLECEIWW